MGNCLKCNYCASKMCVLDLSERNIYRVPTGIRLLQRRYRKLDLSYNRIVELPPRIANYRNIKILDVNRNRLISLPDELIYLKKLETIYAMKNRITALPPNFSQLSRLREIFLNHNWIKKFPLILCELTNLDYLDLTGNKLTLIPRGVGKLHVSELNLNQNQITFLSEDIVNCQRLKTLRIEENRLELAAIPKALLKNSTVTLLQVEGNLFTFKEFKKSDGYKIYLQRFLSGP